MSASTLLVLAGKAQDDVVGEALRIGVAVLAAGQTLRVWSAEPLETLSDDALASLGVLEEEDVPITIGDVEALADTLRACTDIVCVGNTTRSAQPDCLLVTDDWLDTTPAASLLNALRDAGQVLRIQK